MKEIPPKFDIDTKMNTHAIVLTHYVQAEIIQLESFLNPKE